MSFDFSILAREFQFAIAFGEDFEAAAGEAIRRSYIPDGRV
jgi:hypothetical protein